MDNLTPKQRTKNMKAIKSKNTTIEQKLRSALWSNGIRYRKNYKQLIGTPDIVLTKYKIAIFCDGDFWHGKNNCEDKITSNKKYWTEKIKRNKERDLEITIALRDQGWIVLRFWEDDIITHLDYCLSKIYKTIKCVKTLKIY
jgi:DNA mismatch endonuclease Vsr